MTSIRILYKNGLLGFLLERMQDEWRLEILLKTSHNSTLVEYRLIFYVKAHRVSRQSESLAKY